MLKKMLREALAFKALISEIEWSDTFSDVKQSCIDPKEVTEYLNKVKNNASTEYGEREKFHKGLPYVHAKSSFLIRVKMVLILSIL